MTDAYPALVLVGKRDADPPAPDAVTEAITAALNDADWSAKNHLVDVRQGTMPVQDEWPPEPPVEIEATVAVLDKSLPATADYPGPFQTAIDGLHAAMDIEVWVDAVVR